ncbi:Carbon monoxide dehydrogenase large chain [Roseivivax jejudonensis]|uniref:Carbon monoxide dehydrogenase large chain n=1 Tax=Roseivivax jejudonensis TaxID=1529041 RepID=A0A1X6ZWE0_9RHOB|nr:xanthine dehydrogenase family protein molybdopterin-binding subunit [Roseivivax jejudonensis]SLN63655.1 Carbon monoxide dehydrogenase large chain [Roseivivax jejudonensis]
MTEWTGRVEDRRLLTGAGRYAADALDRGTLHLAFLRAPVAGARITGLDVAEAAAMPGVAAVLTAADLAADGIGPIAHEALARDDGGPAVDRPQPILAGDEIGYAGQAVAAVVAETREAAQDAAEAIVLDTEDIDPPSGVAFLRRHGSAEDTEAALARAAHRATIEIEVPRVTAFALEPRAAIAWPQDDGRMLYRTSTQNPFAVRGQLAAQLNWAPERLHVVAEDVGGSFGLKGFMAPEDAVLCWAADRLGRAIAWLPGRSETMLGDAQGRGAHGRVTVGLGADLEILAIEAAFEIDAGAYPGRRAYGVMNNINGLTGMYRVPVLSVEIAGMLSARPPLAPFRGNGRPEATHAIERALDAVARAAGADPVEIRARNLIGADEMPVTTALGATIDCGDFARVMAAARALNGDPAPRRAAAEARGRLYGVGLANCIESAGGPMRQPKPDCARLDVDADGRVTVAPGVMSVGQGHETGLGAMVAARLGIDRSRIDYRHGDTEAVRFGRGSGGSSGLTVAGSALAVALDALIADGAARAADMLGCDAGDVSFRDGAFHRDGSNESVDLGRIAAEAGGWRIEETFTPDAATFPNGTHLCEVEIDPETGRTEVVRYAAVEDVGTVMNPVLVEGQLHGGIAQGLSLGLGERIVHDADGQLLTGSLMDYAMLRASDLPGLRLGTEEVPTALNPLGVKGVGEAGAVGATAALASAVSDALARAGVTDFDLPASPCRVWEALAAAGRDVPDA